MFKLHSTYPLDPLCFWQCFHLAHPELAEPKSGIGPSDCVRYHFKDEKSCSDTPKHTKSESCTRYLFKNPDHPGHSGQRGNTGHPGHSSTWSYWTPMSPCSPRSPRQVVLVTQSVFECITVWRFFLLPPAIAHPQWDARGWPRLNNTIWSSGVNFFTQTPSPPGTKPPPRLPLGNVIHSQTSSDSLRSGGWSASLLVQFWINYKNIHESW